MKEQISRKFAVKMKNIILREKDCAYNQDWLEDMEKAGYIKCSRKDKIREELRGIEIRLVVDRYYFNLQKELIEILDQEILYQVGLIDKMLETIEKIIGTLEGIGISFEGDKIKKLVDKVKQYRESKDE